MRVGAGVTRYASGWRWRQFQSAMDSSASQAFCRSHAYAVEACLLAASPQQASLAPPTWQC